MSEIAVTQRSFLAINREERFFCSLLTHGLLRSETLRKSFYGKLDDETGINLSWETDETEVYSEVAWLRDHWRNLGDPRHWSARLTDARTEFLTRCLTSVGRDLADVEHRKFFTTDGKVPKVVSPGRWPLAELTDDPQLRLLKWAFNSKPDFLFICRDRAVMIEAKVESGPGKGPTGFSQNDVQEALLRLIPAVAPYLKATKVKRVWLARHPIASSAPTIQWADVASMVSAIPKDELDRFAREGLMRFANRVLEGPLPAS